MMKKFLAGILEFAHLAAIALLFSMTIWMANLSAPVRSWEGSGVSNMRADSVAEQFQHYLRAHGPWLAAVAVISVALAAFLRGDGKKIVAGLRIVAAGAVLLFALWAFMGLPKERYPLAWNCLFVSTGIDLLLTAFLVGGGGAKGAAKSSGGDDKKK